MEASKEIRSPVASEEDDNKIPTPVSPVPAPVTVEAETINDAAREKDNNNNKADEVPKIQKKSPVSTKDQAKWKFNMANDLSRSELSKLPNEEILASWRFKSTSMSQTEWIATFLTCGLYYFCTRILLKRNRNYAIHITDKSIFVKEEMYEERFGCSSMLMENQVTFPIKSLSYICAEETQSRLCNLMPAAVALEMRFGRYPKDSELPETIYRSLFEIFIKPFTDATLYALKKTFGIDFDSNPIALATQIMAAAPQMASMHSWIIFGAFFALSLLQQMYKGIWQMLKAAMLDPSIGPRMVIGAQDATSFRLEADISEDPECCHHMKSILQTIAKHLPDREVLRESLKPRVRGSIVRIAEGSTPQQLNNKKTYEQGDNYVILEDYLFIPESETIFDICQCNPYITLSDWKRIIFTFGLYYFTDLAGHISHRKNMFFTKLRCIHHSVLLSGSGAVEHSRLEYWVNDQFTNMAVVDFKRKSSFRATAKNMGWISFEMTTKNKACMMFVFRSMFRARYEAPKTPGLTFMSSEEWRSDENLNSSTLTACALTESESIDCAVYSKQYLFTIVEYILGCCCCLKVPEASVTVTDETLYIEQYTKGCGGSTRLFVCLPWCDVDGIYWQNFDARGPTSIMYCVGLCVLCFFVPCMGFCACIYYCCTCCASAPENYDTFDDHAYGQKGARVRICAAKNSSFLMGINLPTKYYGMRHAVVNALVDSVVSRSLKAKNEIARQLKGGELDERHLQSIASTGSIKNFTGDSVGSPMAGIHHLTQQVSNESEKVVSVLHRGSSNSAISPPPPPPPSPRAVGGIVVQATAVTVPSAGNVITAQPTDGTPVIVQGYAIPAPGQPSTGPVHFTQYATKKPRIGGPVSTGGGMHGLNFPMSPPNALTCQSLMPDETILGGWRFETSLLENWELLYYILTMGVGFFIHMMLHQYRTFTSIYVTKDRILIQEEVYNQEYFCTTRIMEDEVSFMVSDISYINVVELGAQWFGIIPARTWLEIRFGQHPAVTEDPPGLGSFPSLSGKSNNSLFTVAYLHAMSTVYGIKEMDDPSDVMHAYLSMARSVGVLTIIMDSLHFYLQFGISFGTQLVGILKAVLFWICFGSQTDDHAVGPKLVNGSLNGRRHFVGFQTSHAKTVVKEFVQLVSQLNAAKTVPMNPSVELDALAPGKRYDLSPDNEPTISTINNTNVYGNGGGEFHIMQRLWSLLSDEIVYDVTPFNPRMIWSCENLYRIIASAGLYYIFVIWPMLQFKKSYMITNRRLIRHITRTTTCLVKYSHLEMWFLSPINSYTVIAKEATCCRKPRLEFVTDSSRFGPFTFFIRNGDFMKNVLKVVSGDMKEYFPPLVASSSNMKKALALTREEFLNIPQTGGKDCFTAEFMAAAETIESATGVTLPLSPMQQYLCCRKPIHLTLTLTNAAIYLECHTGGLRMFTCLPWRRVGGVYWSNYQPYSEICFWMNGPTYATKLHGHAGAQLHVNTKQSKSFSLGLHLPHRFYGVDAVINDLVATMQMRIHGEAFDEEEGN